jgi:hypothetical protein
MNTRIFAVAVISVLLPTSPAFSQTGPKPLAQFTFEEPAKSPIPQPPPELVNTTRIDGCLALSGQYEWGTALGSSRAIQSGYRAVFPTPSLDYKKFTVVVRLRPDDISRPKDTLLVGGITCRWLALSTSPKGELTLSFNNQKLLWPIKKVKIVPGKWTVLACSFDAAARKARVYVDGQRLEEISLPNTFKLDTSYHNVDDRVWSFTNYSNSGTFKGLVGELDVFGTVLTDDEIAALRLEPFGN